MTRHNSIAYHIGRSFGKLAVNRKITAAAFIGVEYLEKRQFLSVSVAPAVTGNISGSLGFSEYAPAATASSYNLTTLGTSDWAHWGTGGNANSLVHDASGGSQISNVTKIGPAGSNFGGYTYSARDVNWTNGTPIKSDADDDGYIWANDAIGAGFSFTVPATTTNKTIVLYLGGYSSYGEVTATLSDNSAPAYTIGTYGASNYTDIVGIDYNSATPGQTLTITYTKVANGPGGPTGSVDLDAAWLVSPSVAPTITQNPANVTWPLTINVTGAVEPTTTFTAAATGTPTPTVQWQEQGDIPPTWTNIPGATNTTYTIVNPNPAYIDDENYRAVFTNAAGTATTESAQLSFTETTNSVSGTTATAASSYNLTALGTIDWAHWGRGGIASNFDHDATGGSQISNVTKVGPAGSNYGGFTYGGRKVTWTNGTPTKTDSGDDGYIWANDAIGAGYSFTVAASMVPSTLVVYLGGYSSVGQLTAQLSDSSAVYSVQESGTSNFTDVVSINFQAAGPGQTLTVTYTKYSNIGAPTGSVDLDSAWLVSPSVTSAAI